MSLIAIRLYGSTSETAITLVDESELPQLIAGMAAGDYEVGRAALVWSGTKTTVIDPPPPGTDYATFGANTLAGAGGFQPFDAVGQPETVNAVVSQVGCTRTWSVASGRLVADGTPDVDAGKTIVVSTAAGNRSLVVAVESGAWDATTSVEVIAAIDAARAASLFSTHKIYLREGVIIPSLSLLSKSMPGTIVWPNWDRTDLTVDKTAIATVTGGSIDISCRTPRKANIGKITKTGSPGITFTGLVFDGICTNSADYLVSITKNPTHPASGAHLITNCHFNQLNNPVKSTWGNSLMVREGQSITQDCEFSGGYILASHSDSVTHNAMARNIMTRQGADGIRFAFNLTVMSGDPAAYCQAFANLIYDLDADTYWDPQHADAIQTGSNTDGNGRPIKVLYVDNLINLNRQSPGYSQGIYCDDTTTSIFSGYIAGNLIRVASSHGIRTWKNGYGSLIVRNNTCVCATDYAMGAGSANIGKSSGNPIFADNIAGPLTVYQDPAIADGHVVVMKDTQKDIFVGPFINDARGDVPTSVDQSTPAKFKTSFEAAYAVKADGLGAGKGFQFRRTALPGFGTPGLNALTDMAMTTVGAQMQAEVTLPNSFVNWVATTSATPPTDDQIIAGTDHTGAAPLSAGRFLSITSGTVTWNTSGASLGQSFYVHALARSMDDGRSMVLSSGQLTVPSSLAPAVTHILTHPTVAANPVTTPQFTPSGKPILVVRTSASGATSGEAYSLATFGGADMGAPIISGYNGRMNVQAWFIPDPGTAPVTIDIQTVNTPRSGAIHVIELTDIAIINPIGAQNGAGNNTSATSVAPQVTTQFPGSLVLYALAHHYDATADTLTGATLLAQGKTPGTSTSNDHEYTLAYEIVDIPGVASASLSWTTAAGAHGRAIELKAG